MRRPMDPLELIDIAPETLARWMEAASRVVSYN